MNMKAEIVEGFQESEIRKVCLEGQGSDENILGSKFKKRRKEIYGGIKKRKINNYIYFY